MAATAAQAHPVGAMHDPDPGVDAARRGTSNPADDPTLPLHHHLASQTELASGVDATQPGTGSGSEHLTLLEQQQQGVGGTYSAGVEGSQQDPQVSAVQPEDAVPDDDVDFVLLNDDVLTSVSNATLVLLDGSDLERMAVLYQFPQFLEHCPDETLTIMVPEIGCYAVGWKENVQMAAAEALYFVVNMAVPEDVAKRIVVAALRIIQESESGEVFDAWGEILSMMLPQVKRADVQALVVPATVNRAVSHTVESRRLAARIIGSLNDTLTAEELETQFLSHALVLCDDHDPSVRAMIAQSLASLGTKLPLSISEAHLWPKLDRLMHDENPRVRAAAMRAVARTAEAHAGHCKTSRSFSTLLLPVFLRECSTAYDVAGTDLRTVDDDTYLMLEIFSEVYGYFLCAVSPLFESDEVWTDALNSLRRMVTCNGPTVRHWCAFNVPAVAYVCGRSRPEKIHGVVQALSSDTDVETRATLAAGIHETTALLADGPLRDEMLAAIAMLMTDQNPQVRMNSLRHFADILTLLSETGPLTAAPGGSRPSANDGKADSTNAGVAESVADEKSKKAAAGISLGTDAIVAGSGTSASCGAVSSGAMSAAGVAMTANYNNPNTTNNAAARQLDPIVSSLETMSHDSWRTQKLLAEQLEASARLIPQEMLCEHVAPLLFSMARESTYLVRKASMSALVSVIRYIPDVRRRDHILKHFRSEWARGKVYWTRLAYVDASEIALRVLSNKLFTQLFAAELLSLARDPVPNVRLRLARLMPQIATACGTKTAFVQAMDALLSDADDSDVVREARVAKKAIAVKPPRTFAEADEDAKKEAAEKHFFIQRQKRRGGTSGNTATAPGTVAPGATGSGAGASAGPSTGAITVSTKTGKGKKVSSSSSSGPKAATGKISEPEAGSTLPNGTVEVGSTSVLAESAPVDLAAADGSGTSRSSSKATVTAAAALGAATVAGATAATAAGSGGRSGRSNRDSASSPGASGKKSPASVVSSPVVGGDPGATKEGEGPRFIAQSRRNATAGVATPTGSKTEKSASSSSLSRKSSGTSGTGAPAASTASGRPASSEGKVSTGSRTGASGSRESSSKRASSRATSESAAGGVPVRAGGTGVSSGVTETTVPDSTTVHSSTGPKTPDGRQKKKGGGLCGCFG